MSLTTTERPAPGDVSGASDAEATQRQGSRALAIGIKVVVAAIAVFALGSPIWVLLHGMGYLNQAPPPFWGMHVGTASAHSTASGPAGFGGC
ncbi:MAG: hypothetical protein M0Z87_07270 [Actinomycetota bacterium]|nr:hypothetical protein [Actinomycetota bacterium]